MIKRVEKLMRCLAFFSFLSIQGMQDAQVLPSAAVKSLSFMTHEDFQKLILQQPSTRFSPLEPWLKQFMSDFLERSFNNEAIKILRERGAVLETKSLNREMLLSEAIQCDCREAVKFLLMAGVDKNKTNLLGETPLYQAVQCGHNSIVIMLLDAGVDKNRATLSGETPLYCAAGRDDATLVKLLADAGADKDAPDNAGITPLLRAILNGHDRVVSALLEAGANKEGPDGRGITPLTRAVLDGHAQIAQILISRGAYTKKIRPLTGATLLMIAAQKGYGDIVKLLLEAGLEMDTADSRGMTALYHAVVQGHVNAVSELLQHARVKINQALLPSGETPLLVAAEHDQAAIVNLLVSLGAEKYPLQWDNSTIYGGSKRSS